MKYFIINSIMSIALCASCSDSVEYPVSNQNDNSVSDSRTGYYYVGYVKTSESRYGGEYTPIYEINHLLLMLPNLYGYNIMIPMPLFPGKVEVTLNDIFIDSEKAVVWSEGLNEHVENLPVVDASCQYNDFFSIKRNSANSFTLFYDGNLGLESGMMDLSIMVSPKVFEAFTKNKDHVEWDNNVESFDLPEKVALKFVPNTFTVVYRPYYQTNLTEL